jgi:hypothetical protein
MEKYSDKFVTYQIAKDLKELGFDEPSLAIFIDGDNLKQVSDWKYAISQKKVAFIYPNSILAPIWQDCIDWLELNFMVAISYQIGYVINADREFNKNVDDLYNTRERLVSQAIKVIKNRTKQ